MSRITDTPPANTTPADISLEQIRDRAYDLWERHHRPEGFSIELWLMAERELRAEQEARGVPAGSRPEPEAEGEAGAAPAEDRARPDRS